ncbi:hypothetical protein SDRG_02459 [Saprolegnia diclina VS20]|uniref:GAF domain-containing protein n=1 Tax=Saprolegnia diclina (strain VS20) TaxID=1156394 RepID=T0R0V0_SAPDV|nr:hypothetical protein SDRG_02459 [Saprolegnia diclina VS20]EQC40571.1 hypothetical protein SDRG_02459 [Saprolegnia diclina VS20]|eukprot:XP_008606270.1 hypothetical protein SDRG_02459 [Saprolegnia diclina VS20]
MAASSTMKLKFKACTTCMRSFDPFHWRYNCQGCDRSVCRACSCKVGWKKRVCWACLVAARADAEAKHRHSGTTHATSSYVSPTTSQCKADSNTTFSYRIPEEGELSDSDRVGTRSRKQSKVDSFLEDGGLRVSGKYDNSSDDFERYSTRITESVSDDLDFNWANPYPKAPLPTDEASRLAVVRDLDFERHVAHFDNDSKLTTFVTQSLALVPWASMGGIHLIGEHYVFNLACLGFSSVFELEQQTLREEAPCSYTQSTPLVVLDTTQDARFRAHPLTIEQNGLAYLSVPIVVTGRQHRREIIGTLDLAGHKPLAATPAPKILRELQATAAMIGYYVERQCIELNMMEIEIESSRGRRKTAPFGKDANSDAPTKDVFAESMEALWKKTIETSNLMRSTMPTVPAEEYDF